MIRGLGLRLVSRMDLDGEAVVGGRGKWEFLDDGLREVWP